MTRTKNGIDSNGFINQSLRGAGKLVQCNFHCKYGGFVMRKYLWVIAAFFLFSADVYAAEYKFYDISDPNKDFTSGVAINDKQEVLLGHSLWTPSQGFQDIDIFGPPNRFFLWDINNQGHVAGYFADSTSINAVLWDRTNPYIPLGSGAIAEHINDLDHVSGSIIGGGLFHWTPATGMTAIGNFNGKITKIKDMNNSDVIVGTYEPSIIGTKPFMWDPVNGFRDLNGFSGLFASANGINNLGQIVGISNGEVVIWDPVNGLTPLGINGNSVYNLKINDKGQISGHSSSGQPFLWDPVKGIVDINAANGYPPKDQYSYFKIDDLNNFGDFTGFGSVLGRSEAFAVLASNTPIVTPEPMSSSLFFLGAGILGLSRKFRKKK